VDLEIGLVLMGLLVGLVISGVPIGVTLMLLALVGVWMLRGDLGLAVRLVGSSVLTSIA
jgi:C4-dicarboxylate transporter, DctM subunit